MDVTYFSSVKKLLGRKRGPGKTDIFKLNEANSQQKECLKRTIKTILGAKNNKASPEKDCLGE